MPEDLHEQGREGAATIKRWLEATTHMELTYDAYNNGIDCKVKHLNGEKQFDLAGRFLTGNQDPISVECKSHKKGEGKQYPEFKDFLCIAYSATAKERDENKGKYRPRHFLWVTYHPFKSTIWQSFEKAATMKEAIEENPAYLNGETIDMDLLYDVSRRITLLVFNPKQKELSLTTEELLKIRPYLDRKANAL